MSERLYRDDVGAAVERLEQLEAENAHLRAELARVSTPVPTAALRTRATAAVVLLVTVAISAAGLALRGPHQHRSHCTRRAEAAPATLAPEFSTIRGADDCSMPYYYDANGMKRYKPSCLERLR